MSVPPHVFAAHFPVALVLTGAAADLLGALLRDARLRHAAGALLVLGAALAVASFLTGPGALQAALVRLPPGEARVEAHAQWGGAGVWPLAALGALRAAWRRDVQGGRGWLLLAAALVMAAVVTAISLSGAAVSHGG